MDLQSIKNRFEIIGNDAKLNYALSVAAQVADTDLSVLIYGESGVGKEVFSKIIHGLSSRRHNPFIAVNCGAIPEGTIDSELFGHEKGSFTSADDQRKGYFETVNGGTIFLDEIGEMPIGTQARLLRVLETGEYIRVGSSKVMKTDVRVVAATNKDLLEQIQKGTFREDLYYRLNTVPIRVPSLKERDGEDIYLLFRKFAGDFAEKYKSDHIRLDESAQELLKTYSWPGNVRELKNIAEQISVLAKTPMVTAEQLHHYLPQDPVGNRLPALAQKRAGALISSHQHTQDKEGSTEREILYKLFFDLKKDMNDLKQMVFELATSGGFHKEPYTNFPKNYLPENYNTYPSSSEPSSSNIDEVASSSQPYLINPQKEGSLAEHEEVEESLSLADREKEFIVKALRKHRGKREAAAAELGISERTLYRKIKKYDIDE